MISGATTTMASSMRLTTARCFLGDMALTMAAPTSLSPILWILFKQDRPPYGKCAYMLSMLEWPILILFPRHSPGP